MTVSYLSKNAHEMDKLVDTEGIFNSQQNLDEDSMKFSEC